MGNEFNAVSQSIRLPSLVIMTLASSVITACGSNGVSPSTEAQNPGAAALPTPIAALPAHTLRCDASAQEFQSVFLQLINEARAQPRQCGNSSHEAAPAVRWNAQLHQAAQQHSIDMANRNFFSHTGSDNTRVAERVDATGYSWQRVGENIAAGQPTAEEALQGWLDSPGHCRNLMNPDFADIAVACVTGESTQFNTYWTNVFGAEFDK